MRNHSYENDFKNTVVVIRHDIKRNCSVDTDKKCLKSKRFDHFGGIHQSTDLHEN